MAQWLTNLTRNLEVAGLIPGLAQQVKDLQMGRGSHCGSVAVNLTSIHEDTGSSPGLTHWGKDLALP